MRIGPRLVNLDAMQADVQMAQVKASPIWPLSQFCYSCCKFRFGRFLNFAPTGANSENLPFGFTERRFRAFWERTEKDNGNGQRGLIETGDLPDARHASADAELLRRQSLNQYFFAPTLEK